MAGLQGCFPIAELSPFTRGWTIRARVTAKGQLRTFKSKQGPDEGKEGKVFNADLLDCEGGEIRANFFNQAADSFFEKLQKGKCFTFKNGSVKVANKQYNQTSHKYELIFDKECVMEEVDDDSSIETMKVSPVNLRSIQSKTLPCTVDLCGVVVDFKPSLAFTSKEGKELVKREISLADDSATKMTVTLWGDRAKQEDKVFEGKPVMCLKGVVVKAWDSCLSGSMLEAGALVLDPTIAEAERVRQWWSQGGSSQTLATLSQEFGICDLQTLEGKTLPTTVSLCGVVVSAKAPFAFTSKDGKSLVKREVTLADDTARSILVTLWGEKAQKEDKEFEGNPTICVRGVLIKEWGSGRSGSLLGVGELEMNPSNPEAEKVRQWWAQGGSSQTLTPLSSEGGPVGKASAGTPATLAEVRGAAEQLLSNQEVYSVTCRLAAVQTKKQGEDLPFYYMACQEPKEGSSLPCNKRVDSSGFCVSCNKAGKSAPRLNMRCKFSDAMDSAWLTTFHDPAQVAIAMTSEKCKELQETPGGREEIEKILRKTYFSQPLQVTVRARPETYNGEQRTNTGCIEARPVPFGEHGRLMLREIREMLVEEDQRAGTGGA